MNDIKQYAWWNLLKLPIVKIHQLFSPPFSLHFISGCVYKKCDHSSPLYPLPGATKARDHLLKLQWNTEIIQEKDWIWRRFGSSILVNFDLLIKSTSTLWTLCYTSISLKTLMIHSNISPNVTTQPKPAISSSVCSQNKLLSIWPVSNDLSFRACPVGWLGWQALSLLAGGDRYSHGWLVTTQCFDHAMN